MLALLSLIADPWDGFQQKLDEIRVGAKLPGIAAAAIDSSGAPLVFVAGVRKNGETARVEISDKWHLGSCTKAMTAAVISALVSEGKLKWTDTLGSAFPELKVDPAYGPVTIRELLAMRGGFDPNVESWWPYEKKTTDLHEQRMLAMADALKAGSKTAKRGVFAYSNTSFVVAGTMAENAGKSTIEKLMLERMAKPLGLKSIGFGPTGEGQPWPHDKNKPATVVQDNPAVMTAAGRVHLSMADWAKFAQSVVRRLRNEESPWPADLRDEIANPPKEQNYAMGWIRTQRPWGQGAVYMHSGTNNLNYCTVWIAPKTGRAYLVATNTAQEGTSKALDSVIGELIRRAK